MTWLRLTLVTVALLVTANARAEGPRLHLAGSVHGAGLTLGWGGLYAGGGATAQVGLQATDWLAFAGVGSLTGLAGVASVTNAFLLLPQLGVVIELTPLRLFTLSFGARFAGLETPLWTPVGLSLNLPAPSLEGRRASWRIGVEGSLGWYVSRNEQPALTLRALALQLAFGFVLH